MSKDFENNEIENYASSPSSNRSYKYLTIAEAAKKMNILTSYGTEIEDNSFLTKNRLSGEYFNGTCSDLFLSDFNDPEFICDYAIARCCKLQVVVDTDDVEGTLTYDAIINLNDSIGVAQNTKVNLAPKTYELNYNGSCSVSAKIKDGVNKTFKKNGLKTYEVTYNNAQLKVISITLSTNDTPTYTLTFTTDEGIDSITFMGGDNKTYYGKKTNITQTLTKGESISWDVSIKSNRRIRNLFGGGITNIDREYNEPFNFETDIVYDFTAKVGSFNHVMFNGYKVYAGGTYTSQMKQNETCSYEVNGIGTGYSLNISPNGSYLNKKTDTTGVITMGTSALNLTFDKTPNKYKISAKFNDSISKIVIGSETLTSSNTTTTSSFDYNSSVSYTVYTSQHYNIGGATSRTYTLTVGTSNTIDKTGDTSKNKYTVTYNLGTEGIFELIEGGHNHTDLGYNKTQQIVSEYEYDSTINYYANVDTNYFNLSNSSGSIKNISKNEVVNFNPTAIKVKRTLYVYRGEGVTSSNIFLKLDNGNYKYERSPRYLPFASDGSLYKATVDLYEGCVVSWYGASLSSGYKYLSPPADGTYTMTNSMSNSITFKGTNTDPSINYEVSFRINFKNQTSSSIGDVYICNKYTLNPSTDGCLRKLTIDPTGFNGNATEVIITRPNSTYFESETYYIYAYQTHAATTSMGTGIVMKNKGLYGSNNFWSFTCSHSGSVFDFIFTS